MSKISIPTGGAISIKPLLSTKLSEAYLISLGNVTSAVPLISCENLRFSIFA